MPQETACLFVSLRESGQCRHSRSSPCPSRLGTADTQEEARPVVATSLHSVGSSVPGARMGPSCGWRHRLLAGPWLLLHPPLSGLGCPCSSCWLALWVWMCSQNALLPVTDDSRGIRPCLLHSGAGGYVQSHRASCPAHLQPGSFPGSLMVLAGSRDWPPPPPAAAAAAVATGLLTASLWVPG